MSRPRVATMWLDGCSGCHMSLLDLDEKLADVLAQVELVYGPLLDIKTFPERVDVTLVEGAVSSEDDLEHVRTARARSKVLIALGDCAVTGNVPALRNAFGPQAVLDRAYRENVTQPAVLPHDRVPRLLDRVVPVHEVVPVDLFLPGCPPPAAVIGDLLTRLIAGTPPTEALGRFG